MDRNEMLSEYAWPLFCKAVSAGDDPEAAADMAFEVADRFVDVFLKRIDAEPGEPDPDPQEELASLEISELANHLPDHHKDLVCAHFLAGELLSSYASRNNATEAEIITRFEKCRKALIGYAKHYGKTNALEYLSPGESVTE